MTHSQARGADPARSWASSEGVRKTMQANRGRDTGPELAVRRILHKDGFRYWVNRAPLGGRRTADIVFPRQRVAVYIDGCFWHGCPHHYVAPKSNVAFWLDKVGRNRERDAETTSTLTSAGWIVLRVWEHESPTSIAAIVEAAVIDQRGRAGM
ncbi:very short patch repair endonuclease [Glaciibacter sp. 2TAF33]|uniref:very short patch repair endonuclease n=1 Tax=Glaciibacter sp. 2TAF33 TaxID=3233015 RepID=UPI003F91A363